MRNTIASIRVQQVSTRAFSAFAARSAVFDCALVLLMAGCSTDSTPLEEPREANETPPASELDDGSMRASLDGGPTQTTIDGGSMQAALDPARPTFDSEPPYSPGLSNEVSWRAPAGAANIQRYELVVAPQDACTDEPPAMGVRYLVDDTRFEARDLRDGVRYCYWVRARDEAGRYRDWSQPVFSTQDTTPPRGSRIHWGPGQGDPQPMLPDESSRMVIIGGRRFNENFYCCDPTQGSCCDPESNATCAPRAEGGEVTLPANFALCDGAYFYNFAFAIDPEGEDDSLTGGHAECRLDDGAFGPCRSPFLPPDDLSPGEHTFEVRAVDAAGNIESEPDRYTWRVGPHNCEGIDEPGILCTLAGPSGMGNYGRAYGDGQFIWPSAVVEDEEGNLIVANSSIDRIQKITPNGFLIPLVGGDPGTWPADATRPHQASLEEAKFVVVDGEEIYFSNQEFHVVQKVDRRGRLTVVAGLGRPVEGDDPTMNQCADGTEHRHINQELAGYNGDNIPATEARLCSPLALEMDGAGGFFIADWINHRIRHVDSNGIIHTVAGNGGRYETKGDCGPATDAKLWLPYALAYDQESGDLYFSEATDYGPVVRVVSAADGRVHTVAGEASDCNGRDPLVPAGEPIVREPVASRGMAVREVDGARYLCMARYFDAGAPGCVARLNLETYEGLETVAGVCQGERDVDCSFDAGVLATEACLYPRSISFDHEGRMLIAHSPLSSVRRIGHDGRIEILGQAIGIHGYVDGTRAEARFRTATTTQAMALNPDQTELVLYDDGNRRWRRLSLSEDSVTTFAGGDYEPEEAPCSGGGYWGGSVAGIGWVVRACDSDSDAQDARFWWPRQIAYTHEGILVPDGPRLVSLDPAGTRLDLVAGSGCSGRGMGLREHSCPEPGSAAWDSLSASVRVSCRLAGDLGRGYDCGNVRVPEVEPALTTGMNRPSGVTEDAFGEWLVADPVLGLIRRIDRDRAFQPVAGRGRHHPDPSPIRTPRFQALAIGRARATCERAMCSWRPSSWVSSKRMFEARRGPSSRVRVRSSSVPPTGSSSGSMPTKRKSPVAPADAAA